MKRTICQKVFVIVAAVLILYIPNALGQEREFPIRPINLYIGYPPGGGAATTGAVWAEGMKKYLNQPMIVNYKTGAAQAICAEFVANSKPDGYNLFYVSYADLIAKVSKEGSTLKFRLEDLDSLGAAPYTPFSLTVNDKSPWKTVEDLIAAARKTPGGLAVGSPGTGTLNQMLAELFSIKTGIVLNHVPFSGGGPANTALLGEHVQMGFMSVGTYGALIKPGGGLRTLLVFDSKRDPTLPDVPTAVEKGIDIVLGAWFGLYAPKMLPKPVRTTLIQAYEKTAKDPEMISKITMLGFNMKYLRPEEANEKIQKEYKLCLETWEKLASTAK